MRLTLVKGCDSCPMEAEGACMHPFVDAQYSKIGACCYHDSSTAPEWCPLRDSALTIELQSDEG